MRFLNAESVLGDISKMPINDLGSLHFRTQIDFPSKIVTGVYCGYTEVIFCEIVINSAFKLLKAIHAVIKVQRDLTCAVALQLDRFAFFEFIVDINFDCTTMFD